MKTAAILLSVLMLASSITACTTKTDRIDHAITLASSDARADALWLSERLDGNIPDEVVIGIDSSDTYGIDMTDFENGGYIIREMDGEILIFGKTADALDRAVRKYAKAAEKGQTANLDEVYLEGKRVGKITIAGRDISEYTVVYVPEETVVTPSFGYTKGNSLLAAQEIVRLIEVACGVRLSMSETDVEGPMIKIGYLEDGEHDQNGFVYKVENGNLYINGVSIGNGCVNGVYHFLENYCGWEDLTYGVSELAEAELVEVPDGISEDINPLFDTLSGHIIEGKDCDSSARNFRGVSDVGAEFMYHWLKDNRFIFDAQPCYSEDYVLEETVYNLTAWLDNYMASGRDLYDPIVELNFGMGDNPHHCVCSDCIKVFRKEGDTHAGNMIRFINTLEETMDASGYDGLIYRILAYYGTQKPPKLAVPNEDISVSFCTDAHCYVHPIEGGECTGPSTAGAANPHDLGQNNNDIGEWIRRWGELTDNLLMWYYVLDNGFSAYSIITNLYYDFQFIDDAGVRGVYLCGGTYGLGIGRVVKLLATELQYNPYMTEEEYEATVCRFLEREYGEGWYYIREYIKMWEESQRRSGYCKNCWTYSMFSCGGFDWDYNEENYDTMFNYLEAAIPLADTAQQEKNCELFTLHMIYQGNLPSYISAYNAGDEEKLELLRERHELLISRLKKYGYNIDNLMFDNGTQWPMRIEENLDDEIWANLYTDMLNKYHMLGVESFPEVPSEYQTTETASDSAS